MAQDEPNHEDSKERQRVNNIFANPSAPGGLIGHVKRGVITLLVAGALIPVMHSTGVD